MTNTALLGLIEKYNSNDMPWHSALRQISETVVFGYVWIEPPRGHVCNEASARVYFILHDRECVGAVYEMGSVDLHWVVAEQHRGCGHLHRALHEWIFPHLFSDDRSVQRATADSEAGAKYAIRQGIKIIDDPDWPSHGMYLLQLNRSEVDCTVDVIGENRVLESGECMELVARARIAKALAMSVSEALVCAYGSDPIGFASCSQDLEDLAFELREHWKESARRLE